MYTAARGPADEGVDFSFPNCLEYSLLALFFERSFFASENFDTFSDDPLFCFSFVGFKGSESDAFTFTRSGLLAVLFLVVGFSEALDETLEAGLTLGFGEDFFAVATLEDVEAFLFPVDTLFFAGLRLLGFFAEFFDAALEARGLSTDFLTSLKSRMFPCRANEIGSLKHRGLFTCSFNARSKLRIP